MIHTLAFIIISTLIVSIISLVGILTLILNDKLLKKILYILVSLSAGALLGGAFLHLIPESLENYQTPFLFIFILIGFSFFFITEKILHWRHCHKGVCKVHTYAQMSLIGDSIHNFIDGLIIAASFLTNISVGIASTIAIALHEIPQELGNFGVLIHGGYKKSKALFINFLTALTALIGGILGYFLYNEIGSLLISFLLPFAAGGFIYVSASDLIPELRKEEHFMTSMLAFVIFVLGIALIYFV
jgi:zinc and cadmium transporter